MYNKINKIKFINNRICTLILLKLRKPVPINVCNETKPKIKDKINKVAMK